MVEVRCLVLLTTAESEVGPLRASLDEWCRAGLLGEVGFVSVADLLADGQDAECNWATQDGLAGRSIRGMAVQTLTEFWLVALRGPATADGRGGSRLAPDATGRRGNPNSDEESAEEKALAELRAMLGKGVTLRSMTVTVPSRAAQFTHQSFSPLWDLHLLHDRKVAPDTRATMEDAAARDPLTLAASVALCAAGGWTGSSVRLDRVDPVTGPVKHPRIVHAQQRVLLAPDLAYLGLPAVPPWPTPRAAGVQRALPGSKPPVRLADHLIKQCRFECELPADSAGYQARRGLWRSLIDGPDEPAPRMPAERALHRLAERTQGFAPEPRDGMAALAVGQPHSSVTTVDLVGHIRQSNFPIGQLTAGAEGASPETWELIRGIFFSLIDGTPPPNRSQMLMSHEGADGQFLVWPDPSALAPPRAGSDQPETVHIQDRDEHEMFRHDAPGDWKLAQYETASIGFGEGDEVTSTEQEDKSSDEPEPPDDPKSEQTSAEAPKDSRKGDWFRDAADNYEIGGDNDTLMLRLSAGLHHALTSADRSFRYFAALRPGAEDYEPALAARTRTLQVTAAWLALFAMAVIATVDQRWPFLGDVWESITPWDARPWYQPANVPWVWLSIVISVVLVGGFMIGSALMQLNAALDKLHQGERLRHDYASNAAHYAGEMLRLQSLIEQLHDHRQVITEMLHRPFGSPNTEAQGDIDIEDLNVINSPPASMLVATAPPAESRLDQKHRTHQQTLVNRGWLTAAYDDVLRVWKDDYRNRTLEDQCNPDADASIPGAIRLRDRRDGSPILGPREDFAQAVASDGWALQQARRDGWMRLLAGDSEGTRTTLDAYLGLLDGPVSLHGPVEAATDARSFFDLGASGETLPLDRIDHRFSWQDLLIPAEAAARREVNAVVSDVADIVTPQGSTMTLMAWRLEYSEPVKAQALQGWQTQASEDDTQPEGVI